MSLDAAGVLTAQRHLCPIFGRTDEDYERDHESNYGPRRNHDDTTLTCSVALLCDEAVF
eukprot:CAMPEP_0119332012 /NCGR_PEP_ID=MMETSP1333-20130426/81850_1 /TAXON_ID=418940 /ORGANISM="Scyphosphaera apsteinii, Strain RCC1455" /LENGTH=58 /DNA_ID=CAMNT_0007341749 /DNA_START=560 /DNA_END=736 /DNA_ORIENTATION=-